MSTKTCVITGASRGIGLATALRFAASGYQIVASARNEDVLEQAAAEIREAGGECETLLGDVGDPDSGQKLAEIALRRFGRIDVLVNNAGYAPLSPIEQMKYEEFERSLSINLRAVFLTTQAVWPVMRAQKDGVIVNISSLAAVDPFRGFAVYGACKAWINLFTQAAADEGRPLGIRVFAVAPGAVETQLLRENFPTLPAEHALDPDAVAAVVEAACDEKMKYATGQTIYVRR